MLKKRQLGDIQYGTQIPEAATDNEDSQYNEHPIIMIIINLCDK
jgi:hypothetical protein